MNDETQTPETPEVTAPAEAPGQETQDSLDVPTPEGDGATGEV